MDLSSELFKTRRLFLVGDIVTHTAGRISQNLRVLSDLNQKPIYIYINSVGGDVYAADCIIDEIQGCITRGIDVHTIVQGAAISAAADILSLGKSGCRYATPSSTIMLHPSSYSLESDYSAQQERLVEFNRKKEDLYNKRIAKACGKQPSKFIKDLEKGLWLTAQEAIKYGVVDGLWDFSWEDTIKTG